MMGFAMLNPSYKSLKFSSVLSVPPWFKRRMSGFC
jgi:hypothetical protein